MTVKQKTTANKKKEGQRLTLLVILDGFGLAHPKNPGNAITPETAPNIFSYLKQYPATALRASGAAVGLFPNQKGNSEAGHLNIGAGRLIKQDLVQISEAIHDGTFFKNEAFKQALYHVQKYQTAAHLMSLLTDENSAHAYPEHLYALLECIREQRVNKVYLHLFTDGRDSSPHGAPKFLHELRGQLLAHEQIATVMGRFYAMDRNKNWDRTRQAYEAMVSGKGSCTAVSAEAALEQSYNLGETDEYVCPTVVVENNKPVATIGDNDAIFFVNARSDRARQLTKAFVQPDFEKVNPGAWRRRQAPKNIRFVAMTDFGPDLPGIFTAFPSPNIDRALAQAIGDSYRQLYISETEKYAHVTYFINGGHPQPINGEARELLRSDRVRSYVKKPGMRARQLTDRILAYLKKHQYNFICVNYPNADMVGHTGNVEAAKAAVRILDEQVRRLVEATLKKDGQVLLVADHGNAEEMANVKTGEMMTEHTGNPVPFVLLRSDVAGVKMKSEGRLADVAPTLLKLMGIAKPKQMTGHSLI